MSEYYNIGVTLDGKHYRVGFHRSGKVMCVTRKTRNGETFLSLDGETAQVVSRAARKTL